MKKQLPRKTVAYVRVSTEDQAERGVSLEAQRARIAAYCEAVGIEGCEYIEDAGCSAKSLDRPGASQILAGIQSGEIGTLIVLKLDRLTRSIRDLAHLTDLFEKHHVAFRSVQESIDTGSAAGRMIANLLGVLAQFEREQIAERTAFALAHKRAHGRVYTGSIPFGYRRDGDRLVADEIQQRALARMLELEAAGASLRTIASELEQQGIPARNGGKWHPASVRSVLRSKMVKAVP